MSALFIFAFLYQSFNLIPVWCRKRDVIPVNAQVHIHKNDKLARLTNTKWNCQLCFRGKFILNKLSHLYHIFNIFLLLKIIPKNNMMLCHHRNMSFANMPQMFIGSKEREREKSNSQNIHITWQSHFFYALTSLVFREYSTIFEMASVKHNYNRCIYTFYLA